MTTPRDGDDLILDLGEFQSPATTAWDQIEPERLREAERQAKAPPEPPSCTDTANAERFARQHRDWMRYCYPWRKWLAWDGRRWAEDETGEAQRKAKETVRSIAAEALDVDDLHRPLLLSWAVKSEEARRRDNMLRLAQSEFGIPVRPIELDADPWLLNVENGTLDLRSGQIHEHRRGEMITKLAPLRYDPHARCPEWLRFLDRVMGGDALLIDFLRRVAGYMLTGDVSAEVAFFLVGAGANGKSTFLRTLQDMLGDYARSVPAEMLVEDKSNGATPERMILRGTRLAVCQETAEGKALNAATLKQITSRDKIAARALYQDACEFEPSHKLLVGTNHKPKVRSADEGTWRRILLVPFTVTIPEAERDPHLLEKLRTEAGGILSWAAAGCREWVAAGGGHVGLKVPQTVLAATKQYRESEDALGPFVADRCLLGPNERVGKPTLLSAYRRWCEETGETALSSRTFNTRISELPGLRSGKSMNTRIWYGICCDTETGTHGTQGTDFSNSPDRARGEEPLANSAPNVPSVPRQRDFSDPETED